MLYVIAGPPRSGKTTLAKRFASQKNIPCFSTDDIQKVIRAYIPEERHAELLPFHFIEKESGYNNDAICEKYPVEQLLEAYKTQSHTYWPGFKELIKHFLKTDQSAVFEGHILYPSYLAQLRDVYPEAIRAVYGYNQDKDWLIERINHSTPKSDWLIERSKDTNTIETFAELFIQYGTYIKTEADTHAFPTMCLDTDLESGLAEITTYLS